MSGKIVNNNVNANTILEQKFDKLHIKAALNHFSAAIKEYQDCNWEISLLKSGKFIEAVLKSLYVHCGHTLPPTRQFKVNTIIKALEQSSNSYDDAIRISIPRACAFIYDVTSNRGTRHDPDKINPNKMDAAIITSTISWILAELIRFSDASSSTPEDAMLMVEGLTEKKYPYFEDISGRTYINLRGLGARETGLLLLNANYPYRILRDELVELIKRHGFNKNNASTAVQRLKNLVDYENNNWKLRRIGRQEAEEILANKKLKK